ncbi:high-affinity potassium transport -like [Lecanosticta acicola]|uniref:Potassium transport protein n=1 Tax=Lecanosticta acicola TaxID=111012 RepID=A0AAI9E7U0_9PEZI|nr:high-affinity potassium transport -like [Lecanosticta acicola]
MAALKSLSLGVLLGPLKKPLRFLKRQLPPLNFITIHYAYFIVTCLISAIILWGSATPLRSLSFTDALFLAISAMTEAGLNTVNLSSLNTFQQFVLFLLVIIGSAIWVSAFVVLLRRHAFEKKFGEVVERRREREKRRRSGSRGHRRASWSISRRSSRAALSLPAAQVDETSAQPAEKPSDSSSRDEYNEESPMPRSVTPPARAGGAEIYGFSSETGEPLNRIDSPEHVAREPQSAAQASGIQWRSDTVFKPSRPSRSPTSPRKIRTGIFSAQGVGARPTASLEATLSRHSTGQTDRPSGPVNPKRDVNRYLESMGGWISRNSQFHGLTQEEREQLGGYEYRAVKYLSWVVPAYFVLWQLLGAIGCAAWVATVSPDASRGNGLNPWWVGAFNAVSAFNNSGMSLLDANMTAFATGYYLIITMGLLILAGNTCFPIFLRLIVWCMYKLVKMNDAKSEEWAERARTLLFLLDHPRRCYTNLFPSRHTWWLLVAVVTLNGVDWAAFEILNIGNLQFEKLNSVGVRVIDGLFQAFAVRSGGFYIVPIPVVRVSLQILYVIMMYISVYPVVITMRNSNVYEERSLGIYADDQDSDQHDTSVGDSTSILSRLHSRLVGTGGDGTETNGTFVRAQLRAQLAHDAWTIAVALFFILVIENSQFERDPAVFSVFNFLFEIVSAYGCVGISIGLPNESYSFCGSWHVLSKLILCFVMLRGRHRGLPVAIDRAILLPGEENELAEEDDGRIRLARTSSRGRQGATVV